MNPETALTRNIRLAVNRTGRARLLRNNVGRTRDTNVTYGLGVGSPDLVGVLAGGSARCFAIEVKTKTGRLSKDQIAWWVAARKWGVLGGVATSVDEALCLLDQAHGHE